MLLHTVSQRVSREVRLASLKNSRRNKNAVLFVIQNQKSICDESNKEPLRRFRLPPRALQLKARVPVTRFAARPGSLEVTSVARTSTDPAKKQTGPERRAPRFAQFCFPLRKCRRLEPLARAAGAGSFPGREYMCKTIGSPPRRA